MNDHELYGMDFPEISVPVNNTVGMSGFDGRQLGTGSGSNAGWSGNLGYHTFHPFSHDHLHPDPQMNSAWREAQDPHKVRIGTAPRKPTHPSTVGCCSNYPNVSNNYTCGEDYHY